MCAEDDGFDSDEEEELKREQEQELARRAKERQREEQESAEEEARRAEQLAMISLLRERNLLHVKDLPLSAIPRHSSAAISLQSVAGDLCRDTRLELLDSFTPAQHQSKVFLLSHFVMACSGGAS